MRRKKYKEPLYIEGYHDKVKVEFELETKSHEHHNKIVDNLLSFFDTGISLVRIAVPISVSDTGETNYRIICKGYTAKDCTSREVENMLSKYLSFSPIINGVENVAVQII